MGQNPSIRLLSRHDAFLEEQSRVLRWSAEVLARTDENIDAENSFLLDYDAESIAAKVDSWIRRETKRLDVDAIKFAAELKHKISKDYESAYADLRSFGEKVDKLADKQRRLHRKLLDLDPTKPKRLIRLRLKVFKNLRTSEKIFFRDRRLRNQFIRKVYDIDHESLQLCRARLMGANGVECT